MLESSLGPAIVSRYDLQYSATFYGTPLMGEAAAISQVFETAQELLPPGYKVMMTGRSEEFGKTVNYMLFAFVTALILVYMVLASQFNSFHSAAGDHGRPATGHYRWCRSPVADRALAQYLLDDRPGTAGRTGGQEFHFAG